MLVGGGRGDLVPPIMHHLAFLLPVLIEHQFGKLLIIILLHYDIMLYRHRCILCYTSLLWPTKLLLLCLDSTLAVVLNDLFRTCRMGPFL